VATRILGYALDGKVSRNENSHVCLFFYKKKKKERKKGTPNMNAPQTRHSLSHLFHTTSQVIGRVFWNVFFYMGFPKMDI
jgi:hypothetical protein